MFTALLSLLLLTAQAQASLVKPDSPEGHKLVHRLAEEISHVFVNQSNFLRGDSKEPELSAESIRAACESSKSSLLADLGTLELKESHDLLSAKAALEKAACPAEPAEGAPAGASDLQKAHDSFFTATVYLRSSDIFN